VPYSDIRFIVGALIPGQQASPVLTLKAFSKGKNGVDLEIIGAKTSL